MHGILAAGIAASGRAVSQGGSLHGCAVHNANLENNSFSSKLLGAKVGLLPPFETPAFRRAAALATCVQWYVSQRWHGTASPFSVPCFAHG
jgi:hypothetical protein